MITVLEVKKRFDSITLKSSGIGGNPLYIFLASNRKKIMYTRSLSELLQNSEVNLNLSIDNLSVSHLLQCGVIPPPRQYIKICSIRNW